MKELAKEILEEFSDHYSDVDLDILTNKLNQVKRSGAIEVIEDIKGLLEGYVHTKQNVSLYEYYKNKYNK